MKAEMETQAGIPLTPEEVSLVRRLKRLAKDWDKNTGRLWVFSGNGTLYVMMDECASNPEPRMNDNCGVNQDNIVCDINGIPNDGGDW